VLVVSDGVNALEKAQAHHPELIILDVLMPRMDGRETCAVYASQHLDLAFC
jgi:CheY-like chemotaxis protein